MVSKMAQKLLTFFFEYDTPRILHIRSKTVGIVKRFVQLSVILYIVGYVLIYQKGYQDFSEIESAVTTKVKGIFYSTNFSTNVVNVEHPETDARIWDPSDYVIPPQENGAFFVMTNVIITPNQTIGMCPEAPFNGSICNEMTSKEVCKRGTYHVFGNGMMTGRCVPYDNNIKTCEVHSWCPAENDNVKFDHPILYETKESTVLIKNSIEFPVWKIKLRNIYGTEKDTLPNCRYHKHDNPTCPIFRLGSLVEMAGQNYKEMALTGGVIAIGIKWDCNLDYSISECLPEYSFRRLDVHEVALAPGWNFRYARYYSDRIRTLHKAYGILYIILVTGKAGKFSVIPTLLNVGSGLGLLSLVEVICDVMILHLVSKKKFYREKKILLFNDNDSDVEKKNKMRIDDNSEPRVKESEEREI